MEMSHDQYGLPDLRQLLTGRTHFPVNHPQAHEPYFVQRNMAPLGYHHDTIMVQGTSTGLVLPGGGGLARYGHDRFTTANTTSNSNNATATAVAAANGTTSMYGVEMETTTGWNVGNDGMNTRWPRQETLTLLEIRSRLDSKFKEANQKGPLWDEVSRIMAEEHGYHRSGKKCREKFENLYKYYKKTKEGKAGRQDGKHYRFFRQLEALYGDTSNQASVSETNLAQTTPLYQTSSNATNQDCLQEQKITESLSFSNTSELETSSSENNEDDLSAIAFMMNQSVEKKKRVNDQGQSCSRVRRGWKAKVKEFVESEMRKLMETQETWMERMLKTIEDREQERLCKEEEWRQQEIARFSEVQESWAKERAWVEARDASLMEVLSKFTGKVLEVSSLTDGPMTKETQGHNKNKDNHAKDIPAADAGNNRNRWTEPEISSLIQLKTTMETRLIQEAGYSRRGLWEEIEAKMACLGYDRNADECKEKWESMQIYFNITTESNKKCKEDLRTGSYFLQLESYNAQQEIASQRLDNKYSPSNSFVGNQIHGPSFHILTNEGEHLWDKYGKGKNHQL